MTRADTTRLARLIQALSQSTTQEPPGGWRFCEISWQVGSGPVRSAFLHSNHEDTPDLGAVYAQAKEAKKKRRRIACSERRRTGISQNPGAARKRIATKPLAEPLEIGDGKRRAQRPGPRLVGRGQTVSHRGRPRAGRYPQSASARLNRQNPPKWKTSAETPRPTPGFGFRRSRWQVIFYIQNIICKLKQSLHGLSLSKNVLP
jgi:hypothetical protein